MPKVKELLRFLRKHGYEETRQKAPTGFSKPEGRQFPCKRYGREGQDGA
jgi:hypothetical protein